jgi:hypothetical protein
MRPMSKHFDSSSIPVVRTRAEQEHAARLVREAAALRENLRRRKQQARERRTPVTDAQADEPAAD